MKLKTVTSFILMACVLTSCKKNSSSSYAGNFYVRVPLIENNDTYMVPSVYYDAVNMMYNAGGRKKLWEFVPVNSTEYNIALADSASLLITFDPTYYNISLAAKSPALEESQKFSIVPSADNPFRVAIQSSSSGKFIHLDYCHKGNETWGYSISMTDSSSCGIQNIPLYDQADTCYCLNQFVLER